MILEYDNVAVLHVAPFHKNWVTIRIGSLFQNIRCVNPDDPEEIADRVKEFYDKTREKMQGLVEADLLFLERKKAEANERLPQYVSLAPFIDDKQAIGEAMVAMKEAIAAKLAAEMRLQEGK